jgi:hypothetical protein
MAKAKRGKAKSNPVVPIRASELHNQLQAVVDKTYRLTTAVHMTAWLDAHPEWGDEIVQHMTRVNKLLDEINHGEIVTEDLLGVLEDEYDIELQLTPKQENV